MQTMCVLFDISKTVYCRKLVRFRLKTKMAETVKTSQFQRQKGKRISVSLYKIVFFSVLHIFQLLTESH